LGTNNNRENKKADTKRKKTIMREREASIKKYRRAYFILSQKTTRHP
jgi:hypothetical protein|tara:strand:+ start:1079 stop:1219 length:141 start_codon:yes stop_codon:yes gene_type:complete